MAAARTLKEAHMPNRELPEETRDSLRRLQSEAGSNPSAEARLHAALKTAHDAGWSWPAIGRALGSSHEWARRLASRAGDVDPGITIPERPRAGTAPVLHAPRGILDDLEALLRDAVDGPDQGRTGFGLRLQVAALHEALAAALAAGWDAHGIGPAIGMHPHAVTRFAALHERAGGTPDRTRYPAAPEHPAGTRPKPADIAIPDTAARELRSLRLDDGVNANVSPAAAQAYVRILAYWYLRGAGRAELAEAAGQDWEAIRFRLRYWGFMGGKS